MRRTLAVGFALVLLSGTACGGGGGGSYAGRRAGRCRGARQLTRRAARLGPGPPTIQKQRRRPRSPTTPSAAVPGIQSGSHNGECRFGASDAPLTPDQARRRARRPDDPVGSVCDRSWLVQPRGHPEWAQAERACRWPRIFLGEVKRSGTTPPIVHLNPGVPASSRLTSLRSSAFDASGDTYALPRDYLSKASPEWNAKVGTGTQVKLPRGDWRRRQLGSGGNAQP